VSINGANRLGSNSLPECLVFGARAGRAAAEYAAGAPPPPAVISAQVADEVRRLEQLLDRDSRPGDGTARIRDELQATMEDAAGIYRTGPSMQKGIDTFAALRERVDAIGIRDSSLSFNTELVGALELENLVDIGECILRSGLAREESRGAHQRTDFEARDDERFLAHSLVRRGDDGAARVEHLPVTITRWPPGERTYGR
jgi:fumarate reductase flavoprotein subunit